MFIEKIKIKNFRGLDLEINDLKNSFLIIGQNDSGKTSFCKAIRKVLDFDTRRSPFTEIDSTNLNHQDIEIYLKINLNDISDENRNKLGQFVNYNEELSKYYIDVKLVAIFNPESMLYEEELLLGDLSTDFSKFQTNKYTPLDKILDLIYVNPLFDLEKQKKNFFVNRQQKSIENEENVMPMVKQEVEKLNEEIQNESSISNLVNELNSQDGFSSIFDDVEFKIKSNIDITNIYKSMDVFSYAKGSTDQISIGDGKSKTLTMLLQKLSYSNEKEKIFIVEEPENHLFPLLQQFYASLTSKFSFGQVIYTSHSPYICDFKKMNQIIKLIPYINEGKKVINYKSINILKDDFQSFGYIETTELAEMMFYDSVLLVEGYSEKYFYNLLKIKDESFNKYLTENKFGIFCVYGVDFGPTKNFLESLGIKVYIKTDNDKFKVPKKNEKRYAGLQRVFDCLDEDGKKKLGELLNIKRISIDSFKYKIEEENTNVISLKMNEIIDLFEKYHVYLSAHYDGFEKDFLDFICCEAELYDEYLNTLKESKLKNLHYLITNNSIDISINDRNRNNVLVRFMNENKRK